MSKNIFLTVLYLFLAVNVFAATPTVTPKKEASDSANSASNSSVIEKNIQLLKNKIADQVSKIDKGNKKIYVGEVSKIEDKSLSLKTKDNKTYKVSIEEDLTKIYDIIPSVRKEISLKDLEVGDYLIITGPSLETTISANYIYRDEEYVVISGKITDISADNYTIKVMTSEKDEYNLDVETTTKQYMVDIKTNAINTTGFSKIKANDSIHFVAKKSSIKDNSITPRKIIIIPQEFFITPTK